MFLVLSFSSPAQSDWNGENKLTLKSNSVSGNEEQSFLKEDFTIIDEIRINGAEKLGNKDFSLLFRGRTSNDTSIESEKWGLSQLVAKLKWREQELIAGDIIPDFPEFILSQSVRGIEYKREFAAGEGLTTDILAGNTAQRWQDVWGGTADEYKQYATAGRVTYRFKPNLMAGFGFVTVDDDASDKIDGLAGRQNRVFGLDFNGKPIRNWILAGEFAKSYRNYDDLRQRTSTESDTAFNLKSNLRWANTSLRFQYYHVNPDFDTLAGSASSDSLRLKASLNHAFSESVSGNFSYGFRRNNLESQLNGTTRVNSPQASIEWQINKDMKLSAEAREELRVKSDETIDEVNISVPLRLDGKYEKLDYNVSYEYRNQEDKTPADLSHIINVINLGGGYELANQAVPVNLSLSYSIIMDENTSTDKKDVTSGVNIGVELNRNRSWSAWLIHQINGFNTGVSGAIDSRQDMTALRFNWKVSDKQTAPRVEAEMSRKNLDYSGGSSNDYTETVFSLSVTKSF